jgi:hypothetical protein
VGQCDVAGRCVWDDPPDHLHDWRTGAGGHGRPAQWAAHAAARSRRKSGSGGEPPHRRRYAQPAGTHDSDLPDAGRVSGRTLDDCLRVALDQGRSPGSVSERLHTVGQRAGKILEGVDHLPLGPVVQARDELL